MSMKPLTSHEKIDVCRGLFAFLVVIAHGVDIAWTIHPHAPTAMSPRVHAARMSGGSAPMISTSLAR